jgi:hypothetical protein
MAAGLQAGPTWRPANRKKCWLSTALRLAEEVHNFHVKRLALSLAAVQIFVFGVCSFTECSSFIKRKTILTRTVTGNVSDINWPLKWEQRDKNHSAGHRVVW